MEQMIKKHLGKCKERRKIGRVKYGDDAYKDKNMHQEMREELLDFINYALFQLMKLDDMEKRFISSVASEPIGRVSGVDVDFEVKPL